MRPIDADALYRETEKKIKANNEYGRAVVDGEFLDLINDAFTEDVVPREEVEKLQKRIEILEAFCKTNDRVGEDLIKARNEIARIKAETAREIFEEIDAHFDQRIALYQTMKSRALLVVNEVERKYADTMIINLTIYKKELAELKKKYTEDGK